MERLVESLLASDPPETDCVQALRQYYLTGLARRALHSTTPVCMESLSRPSFIAAHRRSASPRQALPGLWHWLAFEV